MMPYELHNRHVVLQPHGKAEGQISSYVSSHAIIACSDDLTPRDWTENCGHFGFLRNDTSWLILILINLFASFEIKINNVIMDFL